MKKIIKFCIGLFVIVALVGALMGYVGYLLGYQEGYVDGLKDRNDLTLAKSINSIRITSMSTFSGWGWK